jgi:hypothetical protein
MVGDWWMVGGDWSQTSHQSPATDFGSLILHHRPFAKQPLYLALEDPIIRVPLEEVTELWL